MKENISSLDLFYIILLVSLLFTPIVYSTSLALGIMEFKFFYLYGLSSIVSLLCIIKIIYSMQTKAPFQIIKCNGDFFVLIFSVYIIVNTFLIHDRLNSDEETNKFLLYLCSIIIYFSLRLFVDNKYLKSILPTIIRLVILIVIIYECIYAFFQKLLILPKFNGNTNIEITGTFTHSAILAGMLVMSVTFIYSQLRAKPIKSPLVFVVNISVFLFSLTILYTTKSRAAVIGLGSAIIYIELMSKYGFKKVFIYLKYRKCTSLIVLVISCIVLFILIQIRPVSAVGRIVVWKISALMIKDAPLFGHGIGSFSKIYPAYQISYFSDAKNIGDVVYADYVSYAYNDLIQIWVELGVIGVILILMIICNAIFEKCENLENRSAMLHSINMPVKASILAITAFGFFSYSLSLNFSVLYFFIFLGLIDNKSSKSHIPYKGTKKLFLVGIFIVIFLLPLDWTKSQCLRYYAYKKMASVEREPVKKAIEIYSSIYGILKKDNYYLSQYATSLNEEDNSTLGLKILKHKQSLTYSDCLLMADMFSKEYLTDSALKYYNQARLILPNEKFAKLKIDQLKMFQ